MPDVYHAVGFLLLVAVVVVVTARISARYAAREWFHKKREYLDSIIDTEEHNGSGTENTPGPSAGGKRRKAGCGG